MPELETPTSEQPSPKPANAFAEAFSQANITLGLAVLAVVLAGAPYVLPKVQAWQVEKGLMARPDMLVAATNQLRTAETAKANEAAQAQIKAHHDAIFNDASDPVIGTGSIKLVEFLDYQCAYCRAAAPSVQAFLASNPDVQLVVKEYPVVHPDNSIALAAYGIEAYKAGHYDAVHYAFLDHNFHPEIAGHDITADTSAIISKAGLNATAFESGMHDPAIKAQVNRTIDLGADLGINGTPTFIIGDKMVNGADIASLQAAVDAQRAAKTKG